ncbi:hypothetical protein [Trichodesmium erythraeum]|uniref:hypothetical protein n=1 Tax=Trichodesmium erythraeum TaxID=1206 RepID=UPI0018C8CB98
MVQSSDRDLRYSIMAKTIIQTPKRIFTRTIIGTYFYFNLATLKYKYTELDFGLVQLSEVD